MARQDENTILRELIVPAEETQLGRVRDFIVGACDEAGFTDREISNTKLAVDEACTNIIEHGYKDANTEGKIKVTVTGRHGALSISLKDTGKFFDFGGVKDPDLDHYVETGRKGGFGVYLINRLMDEVNYRAVEDGNEMVLTKISSTTSPTFLLDKRPIRGTLRYRFMMRASTGFFLLMVILAAVVFLRQTQDIESQHTGRWMEKRSLAESIASRSVALLLEPNEYSIQQTNLSTDLSKQLRSNKELVWLRVVGMDQQIMASGDIDEIFTPFVDLPGTTLLQEPDGSSWRRLLTGGAWVRDIAVPVSVPDQVDGQTLRLGLVHVGVREDAVAASIKDNRLATSLTMLGIFVVGVLLIVSLVQVFVKPIQVLTDGVRAIGDGNLDGKLDVGGPAEIGAIASVFNEITHKVKHAQESVLEREKMQKEMEVAKEIQHSLLPRRKPTVSGFDIAPLYQAAAEVGGDYYDFVDVDEDTIGVVVADVSGKGVPGSLVMTMIRTALRMEARGNKNASDVMSKMNAFVTDDMKKGMFVTMFYVILDSKNRIISYASAGHNPMILYRHETNETFFLNPRGFPVGISLPDETLFRKSISLEKVKLKQDDMLLIYTDGVTEAMNERREQYGEDRLIAAIKRHGRRTPEEFIEQLDAEIKAFTAGHPQNDDITVVAIKEKLGADDVLAGIRKKLIDLVDVQGLSVKDACRQMKVSPATYYRYKKRLEVMGERGLQNKNLRRDETLRRISIESRKKLIQIIADHPEWGAKRIAVELDAVTDPATEITQRMVYDELKRLNLNTRELRVDYLRRSGKLDPAFVDTTPAESADLVEDLLMEMQSEEVVPPTGPASEPEQTDADFERVEGVELAVRKSESGVVTIAINGHIDSVTSAVLDHKLKSIIKKDAATKIVMDLSEVSYISSGGWGIFTGEVRDLRQVEGDIVLVGMSSEVYDVYELLGFGDVLRAYDTAEEAESYYALPLEERLSIPREKPAAQAADGPGLSFEDEELEGVSYGPEWESLSIEATTVGEKGDIAVLSLRGIIDTISAETLRKALTQVIGQGIYQIVVDLSQVEYVSSGGWGAFTERLREVRRKGGDVKLFGMDPDVYYVFTMLGFNIVLASFDILTAAIADFERKQSHDDRPDQPVSVGLPELTTIDDILPDASAVYRSSPGIRTADQVVEWVSREGGVLVARLNGAIEASAVTVLEEGLGERMRSRPDILLFDLSAVNYVSSTGWGQFAHSFERMQEWGGVVAMFGLNAELHEIYSCLEFQAFLKAYDDEGAALAAITGTDEPTEPFVAEPVHAPETDVSVVPGEMEVFDVDEVLGMDNPDSESSTAEPVLGVGNPWPGDGDGGQTADTVERPDDSDVPAVPTAASDNVPSPDEVDVGSAKADKNIGRDSKIRKMGWENYGRKLRGVKGNDGDHGDED